MKIKKKHIRPSLFYGEHKKRLNWDHPQCMLPSSKRCLNCVTNLLEINHSDEFDDLSSEEKSTFFKETTQNMRLVSILFDRNLKEFFQESFNYEEEVLLAETCVEKEETNIADDQTIIHFPIIKKIRLTGKVKVFGQKTGFYLFNKKNIYGLQLPVNLIKSISASLCLIYEAPNGDTMSERYLEENINFGSKCDPKELVN